MIENEKIKWQYISFDCKECSASRKVKSVFLDSISDGHLFSHKFSGIRIGIIVRNYNSYTKQTLFEELKEVGFSSGAADLYRYDKGSNYIDYCIKILIENVNNIKVDSDFVTVYGYIDPAVVCGDKKQISVP